MRELLESKRDVLLEIIEKLENELEKATIKLALLDELIAECEPTSYQIDTKVI